MKASAVAVAVFASAAASSAAFVAPAARAADALPPVIRPAATVAPAVPVPARGAAAAAPAAAASAAAQTLPAPVEADARVEAAGDEPFVKHTVIDDGRARIEELRVRGQLKKVTVQPKGRAPGYEILLGDGAHVVGDDPGTSRGSAGKRVWNVLRF
jgi:hypothetical protein